MPCSLSLTHVLHFKDQHTQTTLPCKRGNQGPGQLSSNCWQINNPQECVLICQHPLKPTTHCRLSINQSHQQYCPTQTALAQEMLPVQSAQRTHTQAKRTQLRAPAANCRPTRSTHCHTQAPKTYAFSRTVAYCRYSLHLLASRASVYAMELSRG
jgi:hypothetical protein